MRNSKKRTRVRVPLETHEIIIARPLVIWLRISVSGNLRGQPHRARPTERAFKFYPAVGSSSARLRGSADIGG